MCLGTSFLTWLRQPPATSRAFVAQYRSLYRVTRPADSSYRGLHAFPHQLAQPMHVPGASEEAIVLRSA